MAHKKIISVPVNLPRRTLISRMAITSVLALPAARAVAGVLSELSDAPMVTVEKFGADGKSQGVERVRKIVKADQEWAAQLGTEVFQVTRQGQADHPYTGKLWNSHADGIYRCVCCNSALFDSTQKFESGTGWASFFKPMSALNVGIKESLLHCTLCDAQVGKLYADGPVDTGLRYSAYSLALQFEARASS